jgi:hypothetical protein
MIATREEIGGFTFVFTRLIADIWGAQSSPEKGDGYGQYGSIWINMDQ